MLNDFWNFSWDNCGISDEEDTEVGEAMSLVGLAHNICSKVVLSVQENTRRKGRDAGNAWNFGWPVGVSSKKMWHSGLKGVAVADSDWGEDDDWDDDCGDNTTCNVSIIDFENFVFPSSIKRRWSL